MIAIDTDDSENFTIYFDAVEILLTKEELKELRDQIEGVLVIHDSDLDYEIDET